MKRKFVVILLSASLLLLLTGCSSSAVTEEMESSLNAADETISQLETQVSTLESQLSSLQDEHNALQDEHNALQDEYTAYKEKMQDYEGLEEVEAEARRIEAEAVVQAEKEEQEAAAAEAAAAIEAKEKAGYETGISFEQLARTPDDFKGELVTFQGKVLQVIESNNEINIRLAVNNDYDKVIFCGYSPSIVSSRILEDDIITIYGKSLGLYSYESTMGGQITIPSVWIDKIDQ